MLILTANPQPKPYTGPLSHCQASVCLSTRLLLNTFVVQKREKREEGRVSGSVKDRWRKKRRKKERKFEATRESSNVNFPWTYLGVTIKPLVLLKLESKTCDCIVEEEEEAGA